MYYNRHRFYDPRMGSYINQDPIGLSGGIQKYKYPLNPLLFIDSLGLLGSCGSDNCTNTEELPWWKKIVPNTRDGWADYLGKQADYFGAAAVGMTYSAVLAPAAPVAVVIGGIADAGSKMLKPPPNIVHATDTVLDIAGASAPGGFFKDVSITALKKIISIGADGTEPIKMNDVTQKSCQRGSY